MLDFLRELKNTFLDFIYPQTCYSCGVPVNNTLLCEECSAQIEHPYKIQCPICETYYALDETCPNKCSCDIDFYFSFSSFSPALRELIHNLKYSNRPDIGYKLGVQFGEYAKLQNILTFYDSILPVPIYSTRKRSRGYNQSECISDGLCDLLNKKKVYKSVVRASATSSQTKLNREERHKNVHGIFKIKNHEEISGKNIIIVDDVITTGATVKSLASVLKSSGAKNICAISLARVNLNDSENYQI